MKVLHVTNAYPTPTYQSYGIFVKEQIESLQQHGVENEVIFINARDKGVLEYFRVIPKVFRAASYADVVHCHHAYSAFVALFFARVSKPLIVSFLSTKLGEVTGNKWKGLLYNRLLQRCDAFIVKNDSTIEKQYPNKGYYLPNGVDMVRFREMDRVQAQKEIGLERGTYLLFSASGGTGRKEKRYDIFQSVISTLQQKFNLPVKELLLVNVPREKTIHYFNASSVHVLTSDFEGSPNSVKEALACNVSVVSTDVGNVKEIIAGLPGCFVSERHDADEIAELVRKSLHVERTTGRQAISNQKLTMDNVAERLISIYQTLMK